MIKGVEELEITADYIRGLKAGYRNVIEIIQENPLLSKNDIKLIVERQLMIEENN